MKKDPRIEEICDERGSGGDFFVYLKDGFSLSDPPQHCFGARNRREIATTMKSVRSCGCAECLATAAKAGRQ